MDVTGSQGIGDFDLDEVEDSIRKCEAFLANEDFCLDFSSIPMESLAAGAEQSSIPPFAKYPITTDDGVGLLKKCMDGATSLSVSKGDISYRSREDDNKVDTSSKISILPRSQTDIKRLAPTKPLILPKSASSGFIPESQPIEIKDNPLAKRTLSLLPRKRDQNRPSVSTYHESESTITSEVPADKGIRKSSENRSSISIDRSSNSTPVSNRGSLNAPRKPMSPSQANTSTPTKKTTVKQENPVHSKTPERKIRSPFSGAPRAASAKTRMASSIVESRLEAYLREKEERELKECTFHPKILTKKHPKREVEGEAPEDRLRTEGERRRIEHEKMRIYKERAEFEVCTFKPELSARTEKIMAKKNMKPIHERYAETMERHRQKVEELAALAEAEQYYAEVDEKARMRRDMLAQKALTRSGIDPFAPPEERLYSPGAKRTSLRAAKEDIARDNDEAIECSFKPKINPQSSAIARRNTQLSGDFFQRQAYYNEKKMRHIQAMERDEASELTFQPNPRRASSAGSRPKRRDTEAGSTFAHDAYGEDHRDTDGLTVHERLYRRSISRSKNMAQQNSLDLSNECRFVPEINSYSKCVGRKSTIEELYRNTIAASKKDALCKVIDEEQQKECTFKPTICSEKAKAHYNMQRPESLLVQIEMERQQKAVKLNMLKKKLEYDEVQTCSFKPEIKASVPKTVYDGPVITQDVDEAFGSSIKGLGLFMKKQEQARKKQEEQKLRESKVFGLNPCAKSGKPYTIPQPFNLSYETNARKSAFERERLASAALKDCTFLPQTSEKRVKDLVAHILSNDE